MVVVRTSSILPTTVNYRHSVTQIKQYRKNIMKRLYIIFLLSSLTLSETAPVDNPIRIDLPVYEKPTPFVSPEDKAIASEARSDNQFTAVSYDVEVPEQHPNSVDTLSVPKVSSAGIGDLFAQPVTMLEGAILETEGLGSKKLSVKENLQHFVASLFQPKPIVDTISEEEKYGNDGDKFYATGKALVGGASNVSNFINSALEVPSTFFKNFAKTATEKLNNLGGRLVGLYN